MPIPSCPASEHLAAFSSGDLPEGDLLSISRHLEGCPECLARVRAQDAAGDPLLEVLRQPAPPSDWDLSLTPGRPQRLGDFLILREIGRGGMGVVYEAVQESLSRRVALKLLNAAAAFDRRRVRRFEREARAVAKLQHTGIVPVFAVGRHQGVAYYAMQFIEGQSLDGVVAELRRWQTEGAPPGPVARALFRRADDGRRDHRPRRPGLLGLLRRAPAAFRRPHRWLSYAAVARVGEQAARALAHAHARGVLHRDVKPANVLMDAAGNVWVTDFGLAKGTEEDDLSRTGDLMGTLRYLAPERCAGQCDARSDVFGLGLTLYELLTLRPAYDAIERAELLREVMHAAAPPPRRLAPDVPLDLETIVLKALTRDPADRYANAAELADDLERFLTDRPIRARRVGPLGHALRWQRRHPYMALLLVGLALALAAGLGGMLRGHRLAEEARVDEANHRRAADAAREVAARDLYSSRIAQARLELDTNHLAAADLLLDACLPRPGETDQRDGEWHHLKRLCRGGGLELRCDGPVADAAFSPDSARVVAVGDGGVRVWGLPAGRVVQNWAGHETPVRALASRRDGLLALAGAGRLSVLDPSTGGQRWTVRPEGEAPTCLAWVPDGSLLVGDGRGDLALQDGTSGAMLWRLCTHQGPLNAVAVAPDGATAATAGQDGTLRRWDLAQHRERGDPLVFPAPFAALNWTPDGRHLILAGPLGGALYRVDGDRLVPAGAAAVGPVLSADCDRSGRRAAFGCQDGTVRVWDLGTGKEAFVLRGQRGPVTVVRFSPDGKQILSASRDGVLRVRSVDESGG